MKAPRRRPAAIQTRMSGGPPGDWKMEEKPGFCVGPGVPVEELDVVDDILGTYLVSARDALGGSP